MGGKFDKSFNEAAYRGIERWKQETGKPYLEFEISNDTQRVQAIRRMAERGANPIISIGFAQALGPGAGRPRSFPKSNFAIIDAMVVNQPNVQSVVFKEHEGSFLVGALAIAEQQDRQGGLHRRHGHSPDQASSSAATSRAPSSPTPRPRCFSNMTGTTSPAPGTIPTRGGELAKAQFAKGSDVVFAAAGGTGTGVYQAAKDAGKLAIGVDSNQNHLQPGTMLSSMVKRVDVAVYNVLKSWTRPACSVLGLKEGGVDYAVDQHNAKLISPGAQDQGRGLQGRHHRRQDQGGRLQGRQRLQVLIKKSPRHV